MNFQGAIFDLDGTLLDTMEIWEKAPVQAVRQLGGAPPESLAEELREMGFEEACRHLVKAFGLPCSSKALHRQITALVEEAYSHAPWKPGAKKLLSRLGEWGVPCCVATAAGADLARTVLTRLGAPDSLAFVLSCDEWGDKTKPDIFLEAARRLGVTSPQRAVVFEDSLFAAQTAKRAGFLVAAVYDRASAGDRESLQAVGDWYISALDEWPPLFQRGQI